MMSLIAEKHGLSDSLWTLASCFYTRNLDLEEAYCVPLTLVTNGPWLGEHGPTPILRIIQLV